MTTPDGSLEAQVRRVFRESVLLTPAEQAYCDALLARIRLVEVETRMAVGLRQWMAESKDSLMHMGGNEAALVVGEMLEQWELDYDDLHATAEVTT